MNSPRHANSRGARELGQSVLGDIAVGYVASLKERRLAVSTIEYYLCATSHFAQWLEKGRKESYPPLRENDVDEFLSVHLKRCRCTGRKQRSLHTCRAALRHLVAVLHDRHLYEEAPRQAPTPVVDQEIHLFDGYLRDVCGSALQTRLHRTRHVREFLAYVFGDKAVRHETIRPEYFGQFLTLRARVCLPSTLGVYTGGLRSYVRFLEFRSQCAPGLADAVPRVARWRLASLPVHLTEDELRHFLESFDRRSVRGRRDYAMALCLAVLGLRASEVAALRLSDIDWRAGTLTIRPGKTHRERMLPLCHQVGCAIAAYVRFRPRTTSDGLFVRIGATSSTAAA